MEGAILGGQRAAAVSQQRTAAAYEHVLPVMRELRLLGWSYARIAVEPNARGITNRNGQLWTLEKVGRICRRNGLAVVEAANQ